MEKITFTLKELNKIIDGEIKALNEMIGKYSTQNLQERKEWEKCHTRRAELELLKMTIKREAKTKIAKLYNASLNS